LVELLLSALADDSGAKALVELDTLRGILNALSVLFAQGLLS
jgi:hypothetical protein